MTNYTCQNCSMYDEQEKWENPDDPNNPVIYSEGKCRLNPPQIPVSSMNVISPKGVWPIVYGHDWCGAFTPGEDCDL